MNNIRRLVYSFFELPHVVRLDVARSLDLLEDGDEQLYDMKMWCRVLLRARDRGLLEKLREKVREQHSDERI